MCLEELFAQVFCYCEWVLLRKWHQNSYFFCSLPMYHQKPFQQRIVPWKMNVPHNHAPKKLWNQQMICEVSQCRCKAKQGFFYPCYFHWSRVSLHRTRRESWSSECSQQLCTQHNTVPRVASTNLLLYHHLPDTFTSHRAPQLQGMEPTSYNPNCLFKG